MTGGAGPALACSCAYQDTADFVGGADEIFTGALVSMADPPDHEVMSSSDPITYTVAVDAVHRGRVGSTATFQSPRSGASCGLDGMVVDRRYLVFLATDGPKRTASLCGGTAPATPRRVKAVERLTGAPAPPALTASEPAAARAAGDAESAQAGDPPWPVGAAVVGVAALLGAALLLSRRATRGRTRGR